MPAKSQNVTLEVPNDDNKGVRAWTCLVYPESAPDHWQDILDKEHFPWACSPLHDADENPDGEAKKQHWHLLLYFEGKKSYQQVCNLIKPLNGTIPKKVLSMKGLIRYFCHLDNPEKAQYDINDIQLHGGFDPQEYLKQTSSQRYAHIKDMISFIKEHNIYDYLDFMEYCSIERFDDWFPLLCDNCSFVIDKVITSNWKKKQNRGTSNETFYKCSVCGKEYPLSLMKSFVPSDALSIDNICIHCGKD